MKQTNKSWNCSFWNCSNFLFFSSLSVQDAVVSLSGALHLGHKFSTDWISPDIFTPEVLKRGFASGSQAILDCLECIESLNGGPATSFIYYIYLPSGWMNFLQLVHGNMTGQLSLPGEATSKNWSRLWRHFAHHSSILCPSWNGGRSSLAKRFRTSRQYAASLSRLPSANHFHSAYNTAQYALPATAIFSKHDENVSPSCALYSASPTSICSIYRHLSPPLENSAELCPLAWTFWFSNSNEHVDLGRKWRMGPRLRECAGRKWKQLCKPASRTVTRKGIGSGSVWVWGFFWFFFWFFFFFQLLNSRRCTMPGLCKILLSGCVSVVMHFVLFIQTHLANVTFQNNPTGCKFLSYLDLLTNLQAENNKNIKYINGTLKKPRNFW